ncbi:MAG: CDP-alcohol phosphatidyltransferase family protein, partial [Spirochaetales bacterium]|nr:CDP-alcohol phosphatidyltransferase family protein [Spirochaetales bacterium]
MIDKYLRPVKEKLMLPAAQILSRYITPNQITLIAFSFGLLSCVLIIFNNFYLALVFWILNRIIDGLDGTVARISKKQTDWGGYLDIMLDFIIYALIPISFAIVINSGIFIYISLSIMLAIFYINSASWMYLSALLEKQAVNKSVHELTSVSMPTGLIEGTETIFSYTLFFLFSEYLPYLFLTVSGLTLIGI